MGFFNIITKKERKRKILKKNIRRGAAGERSVVGSDALWGGWNSKRTGRGSDFAQERKNPFTGKIQKRKIEVKTGNAKFSKLQRKKKPVMRRINPWPPY